MTAMFQKGTVPAFVAYTRIQSFGEGDVDVVSAANQIQMEQTDGTRTSC
jgi:hypothetical protein